MKYLTLVLLLLTSAVSAGNPVDPSIGGTIPPATYLGNCGATPGTATACAQPVARYTYLTQNTFTAASAISFTGLPSAYNSFTVKCEGVKVSGTNIAVGIQLGTGAGPTWVTTNSYDTSLIAQGTNAGAPVGAGTGYSTGTSSGTFGWVTAALNTGAATTMDFEMTILNAQSATVDKYINQFGHWYNNNSPMVMYAFWGVTHMTGTTPVTAVRVTPSGGTISGYCAVYGENKLPG